MIELHTIVFGLSGNPPTKNHARFIKHLLSLPQYDLVRVVLNNCSPLKLLDEYLPARARLELLQAMLRAEQIDLSRCVLERLEIDRPAPSYMIDTLKALLARAKADAINEKITLALGLDALNHFTDWYQWDAYGPLCDLLFYPREGEIICPEAISEKLDVLQHAGIKAKLVDVTQEKILMVEGSATAARMYYQAGKLGVPEGMTTAVDKIIRARGYYGAKG